MDAVYQDRLDLEPARLYKADRLSIKGGQFALCSKFGQERLQQQLYPISKLDWAVRQVQKLTARDQGHFWISQATLAPGAKTRRISSIIALNAAWVDIDLAHPPKSFDLARLPQGDADRHAESLAQLLVDMIVDAGLPAPTYVVATGGGMCPKWVFDAPLSAQARPRWQSLQRELIKRIAAIDDGVCWPVDSSASDAARILRLVGTVNPRWGAACRVVWDGGREWDFDALADQVLPYSREEVAAWRAKTIEYGANRAAAVVAGIRVKSTRQAVGAHEAAIADEAARALWAARAMFSMSVIESRGGAQPGERNNLWWPVANALAWSCGSEDNLMSELRSLHRSHFASGGDWSYEEATQCAGSVIQRMRSGRLYKMTTSKFLEALSVSKAELAAYGDLLGPGVGHNAKRAQWAHGAMQFEPIRGLESHEFIAEVRRRQGEAGRRTASMRSDARAGQKAQALQLRSEGKTIRAIASALNVSVGTASNWLST